MTPKGKETPKIQFHINLSVEDVDYDHVHTALFVNGSPAGRLTLSHGAYNVLSMILSNGADDLVLPVVFAHNDERYRQYLEAHRK